MSIRIVESPEPLTGASSRRQQPLLIWSDGLRLLQQELRRYCDQKVSGRSFLVAGHRGSGKTTLVQGSLQRTDFEIWSQWQDSKLVRNSEDDSSGAVTLRPLLILLQGPNLLPLETADALFSAVSQTQTGEDAAGADAVGKPVAQGSISSSMETVLIQITLGLYRALAAEFTRSYAEKATQQARRIGRSHTPRAVRRGNHAVELASQFELELDQYPGSARLREYWRLSDSLDSGVLFWNTDPARREPGQGYRELVALSSACEAYQRICGKLSRKDENTSGAKSQKESQFALEAKGSDLLKSVTALLTGGAVGTGLFASGSFGAAGALFAGLLTALFSSAVVKYSSTRSREHMVNRADLFIPDLSVATLDRVLPVLLNRIRRAGLAPVFVVDELDKVDGLSNRITEMVKRLKKLVAENAFFCFLTDRKYFEEMLGRTVGAPYPIEYTYFTNQLFIVFRHNDLHDYLNSVLQLPPAVPSAPTVQASAPVDSSADDASDLYILPYILLHDSQMHPIDLRRQLLSIRNGSGEVTIPPGEVRSRPRFLFALMIQVAVQVILEGEDMRSEIDRNPAFLQLAHDALYYISRRWSSAPTHLDLSNSTGKKHFEAYLRSRMATDTSMHPNDAYQKDEEAGDVRTPEEQEEELYLKVDPDTCTFLFESVRLLASYLAAPSDLFYEAARTNRYSQGCLSALPKEPLLIANPREELSYRWRYNASGRALDKPGVAQPFAPQESGSSSWLEDAEVIGDFERYLGVLTQHTVDLTALSSQFGVIGTSPAWSDVRRAIDRLRSSQGNPKPYPDQETDASVIKSFRNLLLSDAKGAALALVCANSINYLSMVPTPLPWTLSVMAAAYRFRMLPPEETARKLTNLLAQIASLTQLPPLAEGPPAIVDRDSVAAWNSWVQQTMGLYQVAIPDSVLKGFEASAWSYWEQRLRFQLTMPEEPQVGTIVCQVALRGPGQYLSFDVETVALSRWTFALAATLTQPRLGFPDRDIPLWLAMVALQRLNFDDRTLEQFGTAISNIDPAMSIQEFRQLGSPASVRRPAGLLVFKGSSNSMYWTSSDAYSLLVCDVFTARNLMEGSRFLKVDRPEVFGITFVAFDLTGDSQVPSSGVTASSDATSAKDVLDSSDTTIYGFFAPNPNSPIPLLVDDPERYAGLESRYTLITANNPQELFHAVAQQLPRDGVYQRQKQ